MIVPGSISRPVWNSSRADLSAVGVPRNGTAWHAERSAFCSLLATTGIPSTRIIVCSPSPATALLVLDFVSKAEKYSSQLQWCGAFAPTAMPERRDDLLEWLATVNRFAERISEFADRPNHRMDAFSQILSGVQLNGAVFFRNSRRRGDFQRPRRRRWRPLPAWEPGTS
jgi:hypothetical protein